MTQPIRIRLTNGNFVTIANRIHTRRIMQMTTICSDRNQIELMTFDKRNFIALLQHFALLSKCPRRTFFSIHRKILPEIKKEFKLESILFSSCADEL